MYPKGTIYKRGDPNSGEFRLRPSFSKNLLYYLIRSFGGGLVGFAVISAIFSFGPVVKEEVLYTVNKKEIAVKSESGFGSLLDQIKAESTQRVKEEAAGYGIDPYFSILIPKIGAASNVIANVSTINKDDYLNALQKGVAHARGTYFPGQGENIFLFSHSTDSPANFARYNAVFYLLNKMEPGDEIIVFFADKKYVYKVTGKLVIEPNDTTWLENIGHERLVLQTCYPPGTSLKRQLVIAEPL